MIGGYVYFNSKLLLDIVNNSEINGSHEFENCYDIALESVSTKKLILGNTGIGTMYISGGYAERDGIIGLILYGNKPVTCTFRSSDKNHYTIGG